MNARTSARTCSALSGEVDREPAASRRRARADAVRTRHVVDVPMQRARRHRAPEVHVRVVLPREADAAERLHAVLGGLEERVDRERGGRRDRERAGVAVVERRGPRPTPRRARARCGRACWRSGASRPGTARSADRTAGAPSRTRRWCRRTTATRRPPRPRTAARRGHARRSSVGAGEQPRRGHGRVDRHRGDAPGEVDRRALLRVELVGEQHDPAVRHRRERAARRRAPTAPARACRCTRTASPSVARRSSAPVERDAADDLGRPRGRQVLGRGRRAGADRPLQRPRRRARGRGTVPARRPARAPRPPRPARRARRPRRRAPRRRGGRASPARRAPARTAGAPRPSRRASPAAPPAGSGGPPSPGPRGAAPDAPH